MACTPSPICGLEENCVGDALYVLERDRQPLVVIRNRAFTEQDIEIIRQCVRDHFSLGRTRISVKVCEALDWRQPNGWLKERACREALVRLEAQGHISLPPLTTAYARRVSITSNPRRKYTEDWNLSTPITEAHELPTFQLAKGTRFEKQWNAIVAEYHYLGHSITVGRCLKYLVHVGDKIVGAISFSSPAWRLSARDKLLQELGLGLPDIREQVINNSRFLILPSVNVHNLASRILSQSTRIVKRDWATYYSVTPVAVETFVDTTRYIGTCYRAANWLEIGMTQGTAKRGSSLRREVVPQKAVYLYGLDRGIRRRLFELHRLSTAPCVNVPEGTK